MNPKFWLIVAFLMSRIGVFQADVQCPTAENSITGMFLRGHTFKSGKVGCPGGCYLMCEEEVMCQSYNFVIGHKVCELNNRTKEARPEDFMPDQTRFYMKRAKNRVPLGSIKELPAESCSEIKASEGNEMVNGDYWINSDGNGHTILARCEVPLGSIKELPAESCSEIKASEGNKTVNGSYWINSDGNGQTILAHCEDNWQKINTDPVCFGPRNNMYGKFNITKSGLLKTMKLVHKNGWIKCNQKDPKSYWGCTYKDFKYLDLMTIITNAKKEAILPSAEELKEPKDYGCNKPLAYRLDGTTHKSPELIFPDLPKNVPVSYNQEMQIWYGQDLVKCYETDNRGKTCVDVYVWYV